MGMAIGQPSEIQKGRTRQNQHQVKNWSAASVTLDIIALVGLGGCMLVDHIL